MAMDLGKWKFLSHLDISYNQIQTLPSLHYLPNIVTVNAEYNHLRKLAVDLDHPKLKVRVS